MTDNVPPTDAGKAREGLIDELKTINDYEELASDTSDSRLKAQFKEIIDDEKVHVGNFAGIISEKDPDAESLMREGLKEVKKAYPMISFKDMMCGASHFEKRKKGNATTPKERRIRERMADKNFERNLHTNNTPYIKRNVNTHGGELLQSRAQDSQNNVIGGDSRKHIFVTPQDMGEKFMRWAQFYGPLAPFDFNGREYFLVPGSDGNQYVYVPDDRLGYKYRQLQWSKTRNGTYIETLVTPKMPEHGRKDYPEPMTPDIALEYHQEAQRSERVVKPKNKRDYITQEVYGGVPPDDRVYMEELLNEGTTPPEEYSVDSTDDSKGEPDTVMVPGDVLNDYQQRKTEGRRIKEASKNPLFTSSDALSYAMIKPSKFRTMFEDGSGDEKIFAIGELVLGKERVDEIRNRPGNPEANTNAIAKESARILGDPKAAPKIPNLLKRVDNIVNEWGAEHPAFGDLVNKQKERMEIKMKGDNARIQNERDVAFKEHSVGPWEPAVIEGATKEINGKNYTWYKDRGWVETLSTGPTRVIPRGMSMDEAQGIKRFNKEVFVPTKEGGAIPLGRIQNHETILSDELAFAGARGSEKRDEEAVATAMSRRNQQWANKVNAIAERDQKFGNLSNIQGKVDDRSTPKIPTFVSVKEKEKIESGRPSDWTPPEEDLSEYGQRERLQPLGGRRHTPYVRVISKEGDNVEDTESKSFAESASFREMLKSANRKQWEEKGLPSGSMEATLPAYYRTVSMGCEKDAINVYEHQKMPIGGDGISVKNVPGIGPKISTKRDE